MEEEGELGGGPSLLDGAVLDLGLLGLFLQ